MSLTTATSRVQYTLGADGSSVLTVPFYFLNSTDLAVVRTHAGVDTPMLKDVNYTVAGAGTNPPSGSVITIAGVTGDVWTISRGADFTQPDQYTSNGPFPAATMEKSLDRLTMLVQQALLAVKRALRIPVSNDEAAEINLTARKGKLLGFDPSTGAPALYDAGTTALQPFPLALSPSYPIFLPGVTATTGGATTHLDGLDITSVGQVIVALLSIGDNSQWWKLRPAQGGDASSSDGTTTVVPVTNPSNLRWIRIG